MKTTFAAGAVEHQAQVEFALDRRARLDQQPLDLLSRGPGLVRDQLHAEDRLRRCIRGLDRLDDLDAAALAASARVNLGLDHHGGVAFPNRALAALSASSSVVAISPSGTGTPYFRRISFA